MEITDWQMLARYFAGELTSQQEQQLLEWVNIRPEHRLAFEHAQQLWQATNRASPIPDPDTEAEWATFQQRIASPEVPFHPERPINQRTLAYYWWAAAAVLLLFLGIGFAFWPKNEALPPIATNQPLNQPLTRYTTTDSVRVVYLPDSSRVWLNQRSELTYTFGQSERWVSLQGEAFFEVKPHAAHPFIVQMKSTHVRVLGTAFNVKQYRDNSHVEVAVVSGKVAFYERIDTLHKPIILVANESATFIPNQGITSKKKSNAPFRLTWRKRNNPVYQQEIKQPNRFLTVTNGWRKNALNQTVLEGVIHNQATLASYSTITLRYTSFTKQGKQKTSEFTIKEVILPGQSVLYKRSFLDVLTRPSRVIVEVSEAKVYNQTTH